MLRPCPNRIVTRHNHSTGEEDNEQEMIERLLATIKRETRKRSATVKTTDTRLDRLIVCAKKG